MAQLQTAVLLLDPRHGENVGGAIRACLAFDVDACFWTGSRVPTLTAKARGRARSKAETPALLHGNEPQAFEQLLARGLTAVAVELVDGADELPTFEHPERAVYLFGPEDSSIGGPALERCQHIVRIPSSACLNLAAAVNVVLYDRRAKEQRAAL